VNCPDTLGYGGDMFILGLTGSLGMGKSTTARLFAEEGVPVHDADAVVHRLYEGEAAAAIEAAFPGTTADGKVDREELAARVLGDRVALKRLEAIAVAKKIPLQHEATSATSGTDADAIFWTRGGIASALISLPNRYMHSPVEVVSLKDLELIPQLLAGFAASLKKGEQFKVKI